MYLKSLTLKGFKSFADKTVLQFDPGLNVVVGPNGSGKSNVSDAILWVLGEQRARMLRGQSMEDVIFSGSSARNPVGVAEVTLTLDNTDHALAIEFSEVALTRRMYRSGESEYLINNAPARLMDIQDILHDSGLGKDTHSIISQGKLDSILASKPEERRILIDEAADISKHRLRKARSERKLATMDEHLERVKLLNREIHRQLRPLEKQVDKARRAQELQGQLDDLVISLAVDDLRQLQRSYDALLQRKKEAEAHIELATYRLDEKKRELEKLQSLLEQKGLFVGDLGEQRRRMQDQLGRMDSDMRLLEEKGKNMVARLSELRLQISNLEKQKVDAAREHTQLESDLISCRAEMTGLDSRLKELQAAASEAAQVRRELDSQIGRLSSEERTARAREDKETIALAKLEEAIKHAQVEDNMYGSRLAELDHQLATAQEARVDLADKRSELEGEIERVQAQAQEAQSQVETLSGQLQQARGVHQALLGQLSQAQATQDALRALDAEDDTRSPLAAALAAKLDTALIARVKDVMSVAPQHEALVERVLDESLATLIVRDAQGQKQAADYAARLADTSGVASIMAQVGTAPVARPFPIEGAKRLADAVEVPKEYKALLEALLGSTYVVDGVDAALELHEQYPQLRFVVADGATLEPDGRLVVGRAHTVHQGALERKRKLRKLASSIAELETKLTDAAQQVADLEMQHTEAQDLFASKQRRGAELAGEVSSVIAELGRLDSTVARAQAERSQVSKQREIAAQSSEAARKEIDQHKEQQAQAHEHAIELARELADAQAQLQEAIRTSSQRSHELSESRTRLATVREREKNLARREQETARTLREADTRLEATQETTQTLDLIRLRVNPLHEKLEAVREVAQAWAARLKDRASLAEADSDSLKKTIGDAKEAVAAAQSELDAAQEAYNNVKVDAGRLEVQVEQAIQAIVATGCILDEALVLPEPEDREASERLVAQLKQQLSAIGPVNAVAMDEFSQLKKRADFIEEQLSDLENARIALKKITAAIERKMRNRFLTVYELVNKNFSEVFSLLFPGVHAHLEMTDPDHLADTGIEIVAQPRGKKITKMSLMSGGEKSLTALALLFAVYRTRTVPFYVFDEVEAALDDSNLSKLLDAIEHLKESTQLIVISHQRRTMEQADVLYGVSMQADGVSHVVSQRLDTQTGKVVDA